MFDRAQTIKLAVITGDHPYDVPEFTRLLRRLGRVDSYLQDLDNWAADVGGAGSWYDALLFYNMHREPPNDRCRAALTSLGRSGQGIILLHHAVLAFRDLPVWSDLVGVADRRFTYVPGESVPVDIAAGRHPITAGLAPWTMTDETYAMAEPESGSRVLLSTTNAHSMRALAWTRQHGQSRVFVAVSGHGAEAYRDPCFQTVLSRGIRWAAGKLEKAEEESR